MSQFSSITQRVFLYSKYYLLPFLLAVYPPLFHYGNNANIVLLASLGKLVLLLAGIVLMLYGLLCMIYKKSVVQAANATFTFLLFFHTYGLIFNGLRRLDVIQIEHLTLLPIYVLLGSYTAWFVGRLKEKPSQNLWKAGTIIALLLVMVNVIRIIPIEVRKIQASGESNAIPLANSTPTLPGIYPDIYYIIFDEMAGFEAMREYWKYSDIDNFVVSLESTGFYVAENSHASSTNTFHEIAVRLNYEDYPYDESNFRKYWDEDLGKISDNKVMQYLKQTGYTTLVFDEGLPLTTQFNADVVYTSPLNDFMSWGNIFDDFGMLVLENTMLKPFIGKISAGDPAVRKHEQMLFFTAEAVTNLDVPSPKFVYIHLLIPHMPFIFDADGKLVEPKNQNNWDQYQGYYIYTTQFAEKMIENILAAYDTSHPPVIVFQSDHGARNISLESGNVLLENYPDEYKTLIVNALYLPGCDDAPLSQEMDPINTFPIVFNCYFDAGIPLK